MDFITGDVFWMWAPTWAQGWAEPKETAHLKKCGLDKTLNKLHTHRKEALCDFLWDVGSHLGPRMGRNQGGPTFKKVWFG